MTEKEIKKYQDLSKEIRKTILDMAYRTQTGHLGSSFSIVELLVMLYFEQLNIDVQNPKNTNRDYFILSKGHAAPALYAVLAYRGFFPKTILEKYYIDGGMLHGHACKDAVPGIEVSSGSLGHGLSIAAGIAHAMQKNQSNQKVYTLLGDGECNEGAIWEAAMYAGHHRLDNLTAIVDYNRFQGFGASHEVTGLHPLTNKWQSFGWNVLEIDGHNTVEIKKAFNMVPEFGKPTVIIAHTVSGKGMKHIENSLDAHYYRPSEPIYQQTLKELHAQ